MDGIEGVYDEEWLLGDRDSSVLFFISTSYLSSLGDAVLTEAPRPCSRIAERMYGADEFDILSVFAFGMFASWKLTASGHRAIENARSYVLGFFK